MFQRDRFFLALVVLLSMAADPYLAAAKGSDRVLLSQDLIVPGWQVVAGDDQTMLQKTPDGYLLVNFGTTTLVYESEFGYRDFNRLSILLKSDSPVELKLIPDITTTANYTFENEKKIPVAGQIQEYNFSLHNPNFQHIHNFGIKLTTNKPASIFIAKISLSKIPFLESLGQAVTDYFQISPYSPFTVNVLATPRVFGRSAFVYFWPVFLILLAILMFANRYRRKALWGLLILWLVTDARMAFEFLNYQITDYQTWVKPAAEQKTFRTYGDFYVFVHWLSQNFPENTKSVNFYTSDETHFPRIAQYYLYPVVVGSNSSDSKVYATYRQPEVQYNKQDERLYLAGKPISGQGTITATYDQNSFIFKLK